MLEQVDDTIGVEDVTTWQARARLSAELLRVADCAHGLLIDSIVVSHSLCAGSIKTWQALALVSNTFAGMST